MSRVSVSIDTGQQFEREYAELMKRAPVSIELTTAEAWALICAVQFAELIPDWCDQDAALARVASRRIAALIAPAYSVLASMIDLNWSQGE